jgi:hypothetical protein
MEDGILKRAVNGLWRPLRWATEGDEKSARAAILEVELSNVQTSNYLWDEWFHFLGFKRFHQFRDAENPGSQRRGALE